MKNILIYILLFTVSCKCIVENNINKTDLIRTKKKLENDFNNRIGVHKTKAIFNLYEYFNKFLDSQYYNFPKEKRIRLYLKDYNESYNSRISKIDLSGFKDYMKDIHDSGVFDELFLSLDERYFVSNEIFTFYDSIYYKKYKRHYTLPKDSIFFSSKGYHSSEPSFIDRFYNPFNKIDYCLHSNNIEKESFYNKVMDERFYMLPFNTVSVLSERKNLDINEIHYKFLIIFETLLPIYDYKNNEFIFDKKVY